MPWTAAKERRAVVAHVARCRYCHALVAFSRSRRDYALLDAADELAAVHAANDAEHEAFAGPRRAARNAVPKPAELRSDERRTGTRR